jgi:hypothetical protein
LKAPAGIDLDAPYPKSNPTVAPLPADPEFADEISEDLLEDAAEGLKILHAPKTQPTPEKGISLEDIGVQVQTKHTTQKIYIHELPPDDDADQDETVVDLNKALQDETDEQDTESLDRKLIEDVEKEARRISRIVPDRTPTLHDGDNDEETDDV